MERGGRESREIMQERGVLLFVLIKKALIAFLLLSLLDGPYLSTVVGITCCSAFIAMSH